jgi:hypothetical protein
MERALLAQTAQGGQRIEARTLERVGARSVGDENDYRQTNHVGVDMRRIKAARGGCGKSAAWLLALAGA